MLFPVEQFNAGKVISLDGRKYSKVMVNWGNEKAEKEPVIGLHSVDPTTPDKINAYVQLTGAQLTSDKWEVEE